MARFDDRLPPRDKDGDDFQRFVWEVLQSGHFQSSLGGRYVRPFFASGNDGAIDHLAVSDQDQIVFECKFFGKGRKGDPGSDWTALSGTLRNRLVVNADRPWDNIDRLYKPWFDTDRPIRGYWFCTSGVLTPGAQTDLRQNIKGFFSELSRDHASLAHLAAIDVEVLGWSDFDGAIAAKPPLLFRWFRKLPAALQPLRSMAEGKTFRKFLEEGSLEYFSREEFNREMNLDSRAHLTDEVSILSSLLGESDQLGLVLSGPGGLGKTRLAFQLGLNAESENWLVLHVERNASRETIEELAHTHASPARVLLIIDYAEAARSLFDIAQEMKRVNSDGGHHFRFIATCRASALSAVKEALEEIVFQTIEFSGEPDDKYAQWVIEKILASTEIPNANDIISVCAGLPVMAAFAVFLFERHPDSFDAQFGRIHRGDDFAMWTDKRLKLALNARGLEDQASRRMLAAIATQLPLLSKEYYALRRTSNETVRLLDLLKYDRWIEPDSDGMTAAHDIFADAIAARYIFEARKTISDRVGDLLVDAVNSGALDRAYIAITRLAAHQWFDEIDGLAVIRRAHACSPASVVAAHELLIKTRLPDNQTAIRILEDFPDIADAVCANMSCDGPISYLAEAAASSKDDGWRDEASRILQPFLDRAVERAHRSNMVVRRALRLLPARYRGQALAWIRQEPARSETHFLFVAWLRSGLPQEEIGTDVEYWLANGGEADLKASFVYQAWLDAAATRDKTDCVGKIAKVQAHVLAWLGTHGTSEAAQFVYQAWLNAAATLDKTDCAGKIAKIEAHMLAWLGTHGTFEAAGFVYKAWLDAAATRDKTDSAGKIAKVQAHVLAWLGTHGTSEAAGFVYKAWLDAAATLDKMDSAGKIAKVEAQVLAWLATHGTTEAAHFVYKAWLDAAATLDKTDCAGKITKVEVHVLAWLGTHGTSEAAGFVYKAWLDAAATLDKMDSAGKIAKVQAHVLAWLATHRTSEAAGFVYKAWLDAAATRDKMDSAGMITKVEAHVLAWLDANPRHQKTDFIIHAWLNATRNFRTIRNYVLPWLTENTDNPETVFVLKFVVRERDLPADSIKAVIEWFTNFPDNFDSVCRIWPLLARYSTGDLERPLIDTALLVLSQVQIDWLTDHGVRCATIATIGTLVLKKRVFGEIESSLDTIHLRILRDASAYSKHSAAQTPTFALNPYLADHVADMIERKVIDTKLDLSALERFAEWLAAWPADRKPLLKSRIQLLEVVCPISGLWSRVGDSESRPQM